MGTVLEFIRLGVLLWWPAWAFGFGLLLVTALCGWLCKE
jgi:hypothetical protein